MSSAPVRSGRRMWFVLVLVVLAGVLARGWFARDGGTEDVRAIGAAGVASPSNSSRTGGEVGGPAASTDAVAQLSEPLLRTVATEGEAAVLAPTEADGLVPGALAPGRFELRVLDADGRTPDWYWATLTRAGGRRGAHVLRELVQEEPFVVEQLTAGKYELRVEATRHCRLVERVTVQEGGAEAKLTLRLTAEALASGHVERPDGAPAAVASVLWRASGFDERGRVAVDPDGSFLLRGLPAGPVALCAEELGWTPSAVLRVDLTPGVRRSGVRLALRPPSVVRGLVRTSDGTPLADARVQVFAEDAGPFGDEDLRWPRERGRAVDASGGFELQVEHAGAAELRVEARLEPRQGTSYALDAREPLELLPGSGRFVEVVLGAPDHVLVLELDGLPPDQRADLRIQAVLDPEDAHSDQVISVTASSGEELFLPVAPRYRVTLRGLQAGVDLAPESIGPGRSRLRVPWPRGGFVAELRDAAQQPVRLERLGTDGKPVGDERTRPLGEYWLQRDLMPTNETGSLRLRADALPPGRYRLAQYASLDEEGALGTAGSVEFDVDASPEPAPLTLRLRPAR